ncbi:putative MFS-type transporter [Lentibacillus sp. JNUCC-1]|uniref:MDR family MFS transporter n=1 Tax=Lentibacillus sp. JNUCC-1 TaxID=2654513 RepID=UPI0012E7B2BF|nr:MDR family MFS transporter [Lentibacillus sp. JNUCC-1]MUV38523.1 putative MFS-type transporter [Lentibacillus sp. JNUCC-1]
MARLPSKWLVVISILFGTFTVILNNSMLNPILPHFMEIFDRDAVAVGWVLTIFMVSMGMTMPLTGYLGDRFGKKRVYISGLVLFMVGSISGALSSTLSMIIISRAIQGAAGGLMMPIAMALIFNAFPRNERGLAVGIYGIAAMVAPAIGPTVGGLVIEYFTWPFLFVFNLPFALTGVFFCIKYLKPTEKDPALKFDLIGFILVTTGVGGILLALGRGSTLELLLSPLNIAIIAGGIILLVIFVKYEFRQEQPLLNLSIFKIPTYSVSIVVTATASIGLFSGIFLLPLLIQDVYGLSEIQTGLLFLPAALMSGVFMSLGGKILDVKGPRYVVPVGLVILGSFTLMLGFNTLQTSYWFILIINILRSAGLGMCNMPATTAGMNAIPDAEVAQGSAMNNVFRQIFSSFGIVFFSIYFEVRRGILHTADGGLEMQQATLQALNEAFMVAGVFILLIVPVSFVLKGHQNERNQAK